MAEIHAHHTLKLYIQLEPSKNRNDVIKGNFNVHLVSTHSTSRWWVVHRSVKCAPKPRAHDKGARGELDDGARHKHRSATRKAWRAHHLWEKKYALEGFVEDCSGVPLAQMMFQGREGEH